MERLLARNRALGAAMALLFLAVGCSQPDGSASGAPTVLASGPCALGPVRISQEGERAVLSFCTMRQVSTLDGGILRTIPGPAMFVTAFDWLDEDVLLVAGDTPAEAGSLSPSPDILLEVDVSSGRSVQIELSRELRFEGPNCFTYDASREVILACSTGPKRATERPGLASIAVDTGKVSWLVPPGGDEVTAVAPTDVGIIAAFRRSELGERDRAWLGALDMRTDGSYETSPCSLTSAADSLAAREGELLIGSLAVGNGYGHSQVVICDLATGGSRLVYQGPGSWPEPNVEWTEMVLTEVPASPSGHYRIIIVPIG